MSIKEEILPKYAYLKQHDPAAHRYNSTLEYRGDLVKRQITLCEDNINTLNPEIQKIREKLVSYTTPEHIQEQTFRNH